MIGMTRMMKVQERMIDKERWGKRYTFFAGFFGPVEFFLFDAI